MLCKDSSAPIFSAPYFVVSKLVHSTILFFLIFTLPGQASLASQTWNSQQKDDLQTLSIYLNSIKKFKTTFHQRNPDGSMYKGIIYMNRPGRMRLDYALPQTISLFAANKHFTLVDHETRQSEHYPFFTTPASLLLDDNINLHNPKISIRDIYRTQGFLYLALAQNSEADSNNGTMILYFTINPIALRGWKVIDEADNIVQVDFAEIDRNVDYPKKNFFLYHGEIPDAQKGRR